MGKAPSWIRPREYCCSVCKVAARACGASRGGHLRVPLLRLDFGALYSKWHGESERKTCANRSWPAEALAPCVLWIDDEIERHLADVRVTAAPRARVLGTFLTWLSENTPHLRRRHRQRHQPRCPRVDRKGRLDEIFFVDLPDEAARAAILAIHARKRSLLVTPQEVLALAKRSAGFSGAELEQAIVAALYSARANGQPVNAAAIAHEFKTTKPLSVVMEKRLRPYARGRRSERVPAD